MVSLADQTGVIALCVLRSVAKERYTRSQPHWDLSLLFTVVAFRGKGIASALQVLRSLRAMAQAMAMLPGTIISRSGRSVSDILSQAGFEQLGLSYEWVYRHYSKMPQPTLLDPVRTPPVMPYSDSLLGSLYFSLARRNKCMNGHSPHGTEDQDAFDL